MGKLISNLNSAKKRYYLEYKTTRSKQPTERRVVRVKAKRTQSKCNHVWRLRPENRARWKYVCRECGVCART